MQTQRRDGRQRGSQRTHLHLPFGPPTSGAEKNNPRSPSQHPGGRPTATDDACAIKKPAAIKSFYGLYAPKRHVAHRCSWKNPKNLVPDRHLLSCIISLPSKQTPPGFSSCLSFLSFCLFPSAISILTFIPSNTPSLA